MTARRSEAPPFKVGDVEYLCWITSDGQRYVWRAAEDRLLVGRYEGANSYWCRVDGALLPSTYKSLRLAMMSGYRNLRMSQVQRAG
jgi:hypothetical protein